MDPFSAPPSATSSVVLPDEPRTRRTGWFIAIAAAVVALVAVGVVFAVTRGDDAEKYSLTAAGDATGDLKTMTFSTTTAGFGTEVRAVVATDLERELLHINMDLGVAIVGLGGEIEMILDLANGVTYTNVSFFKQLGFPLNTEWLRMDADWVAKNGQDFELFRADAIANPLDAALVLEHATATEEVGFDDVDGLKVKHYQVTVSGEDAFASMGQLAEQLDLLDGAIPDEIVYDFYVDEQNLIRRVSYEIDIGPGKISTDIVVLSINEPVNIEIPDDDDVTNARDIL